MNILLIGGTGSLINNLIVKFKKEGHRVYLITGERHSKAPYQKVFERYDFPYEATCLKDVFESINMDVTIFLGAFDTNFKWINEEGEAVRYSSGLMNILMSYSMKNLGKFIYLSSEEVFGAGSKENIDEYEAQSAFDVKSMVLMQAEEMCESYRTHRGMDIITVRLDHLFQFPKKKNEVSDLPGKMCLEALETGKISINEGNSFSLLYEADATEYIYRIANAHKHNEHVYNISSMRETNEKELAETIARFMDTPVAVVSMDNAPRRLILSNARFTSEFGNQTYCNPDEVIRNITTFMQKNRYIFLNNLDKKPPIYKRILDKTGWAIKAIIPFLENMIAFVPFFLLNNIAVGSQFFANLDFLLLYVLLFAIVYGQQQAIFSAVLAVAGYIFRQMYDRSGFEVLIDANTYVWIAQLFIVGMLVGYLRDQIKKLKRESVDERDYLSLQLQDIQDINDTNIRVKDALETQIVNQNNSVGKIYRITSELDKYSPEEVLFHAADIVSKLVKSDDVAIYTINNSQYARLFSATSQKARQYGNSVRYRETGELYEALAQKKVFINRSMDSRYPLMANAIFDEEDHIQIIVMVWTMGWEMMTLGMANQLVVISSLINNAVVRSSRYLEAITEKRYLEGTKILSEDAFQEVLETHQNAEREGLAYCALLQVQDERNYDVLSNEISACLRDSDMLGLMYEDSHLYILLTQTTSEDSLIAVERLREKGIKCEYMEDGVRCLRQDRI